MATRPALDEFVSAAESAYRRSYAAFEVPAIAEGADLTPLGAGGECFEVTAPRGSASVQVIGSLMIERLPRRHKEGGPASVQDRVSVLVSSKDIYFFDQQPSLADRYLAESYVSIGYYKPQSGKWKTELALRYDFGARGARGGHPIFHAQIDSGVPGPRMASLPGVPTATNIVPLPYYGHIRMPTANMVGATALLKLGADHLSQASFSTMLRTFQGLPFFKNWRCKCDTLDHVDSAREMLSSGWYGCKPT